MRLVLDCSVAISWCFGDESNTYADAVLLLLSDDVEAIVPGILWLEIVNVLLVAERRQRVTQIQAAKALMLLRSLPIFVDVNTDQASIDATIAIAREGSLAAYDAAYLALAMREGLPLATIDRRLGAAAQQRGMLLEDPMIEDTV
ncbi:MAG: type II toxin-antitoxin system VapC family toxin [Tildeniella nuda ZEHNDER 1965/U140]|jgi:predicted nucleic acid-binding protein|nr:type II toxin-antitoxin system VapC family toxin [Tildeniella nuda ZEHNDER 1965/U140]